MAWANLRAEVALEFWDCEPDMDIATEQYCAEALHAERTRSKEYYELCSTNPVWMEKHRANALEEFHLAGYARRQAKYEQARLSTGQLRLLPDAVCDSRAVDLHALQYLEATVYKASSKPRRPGPAKCKVQLQLATELKHGPSNRG